MQSSEPSQNIHAANLNTLEEGTLPSYEAAVGMLDTTKLPSYRRTFSARFHPYRRPTLKNIDDRDRLFNTVFDDEYTPLNVPATRCGRSPAYDRRRGGNTAPSFRYGARNSA